MAGTYTNSKALRTQRKTQVEHAKRLAGGPRDTEFFACYSQYLEETISQVLGNKVTFESTNSYNRTTTTTAESY
jgi:hypothetical protein